jgi:hypothetical protein
VPPFTREVNEGWDYNRQAMKECPLCGETMRLSVREVRDTIPGSGQSAARVTREWICPECDYFEEAEAGEE